MYMLLSCVLVRNLQLYHPNNVKLMILFLSFLYILLLVDFLKKGLWLL